jgi:hypothetical protein
MKIGSLTRRQFSMFSNRLSNPNQMKKWLTPKRLLIAAAIFHLLVTVTVSVLGRYQVLPNVFDANGIAVGVASDGIKAHTEALRRRQELIQGDFRTWLKARSPFYIKLYSLSYATFGLVLGTSVLGIEPLNGLCYLAILVLVFYLVREFSDRRTALVAAALVALWPSFVLHTTQLLKDPFFIAGMLAFVLVSVRLLSRDLSWRSAILTALAGGLAAALVWLARDTVKEILFAVPLLAGVLFLIRFLWQKGPSRESSTGWRARLPSFVGLILLFGLSVGVTQMIPQFERRVSTDSPTTADTWTSSRRPTTDPAFEQQIASGNPWTRTIALIGKSREGFASEFADAGSNIDTDVSLRSSGDVLRYIPRAVMIGYLAPFPNMWLAAGHQVSRGGRLLSGTEMVVIYLIEGLALVGLWSGRRRVSIWFLFLVSAMGLTSLGLVVLNIGALYRLRYVFIILLIVLATQGAQAILPHFRKA